MPKQTAARHRRPAAKFVEPVNPPTLENVPDYRTREGAEHWKGAMLRSQQALYRTLAEASARDRLKRKTR